MKNSASFGLLLDLRPNLRKRDRTVAMIRSIDMALMGISGRGSASLDYVFKCYIHFYFQSIDS
jgi:hypothetical protein